MSAPGYEPLERPFDADQFDAVAAPMGVSASVVVQAACEQSETEELLALAGSGAHLVKGVVGWVDLTDAGAAAAIRHLREDCAGGDRLVGLRHPVHDEADPSWLARRDVMKGLEAVAAEGLVFDLLVRPHHLRVAYEVASSLPELSFVIDHIAKPGVSSADMSPWAEGMASLAELANLYCKVSGLITEADWDSWRAEEFVPYLSHVLSCFGAERLIFGSDWPVCLLAGDYARVVGLAESLLPAGKGIFAGNARRVYRLS